MKKLKFIFILTLALFLVKNTYAESPVSYQLSTHMLDISKGEPAKDVDIILYRMEPNGYWEQIASGKTDANGRVADFLPMDQENTGIYKLHFETEPYFEAQNLKSIYPYVEITFRIDGEGHYHIPITMSANGYATYRGN